MFSILEGILMISLKDIVWDENGKKGRISRLIRRNLNRMCGNEYGKEKRENKWEV